MPRHLIVLVPAGTCIDAMSHLIEIIEIARKFKKILTIVLPSAFVIVATTCLSRYRAQTYAQNFHFGARGDIKGVPCPTVLRVVRTS